MASADALPEPPASSFVTPLLTDMYQITMAYAYWKAGRQDQPAVFDLFFRKNPFMKGSGSESGAGFVVFAGLEEILRYVARFSFSESDLDYLRSLMPHFEPGFFDYLRALDCSQVRIYAVAEGTVVFPRTPLIRVEGPLGVSQLLETTMLNLCNFASLMATNAARFRRAAGAGKTLIEFGLRRAQGPDGAMSATRYSYMAGFDASSNVLAGKLFGVPIKGTHAHSFVQSFVSLADLGDDVGLGDGCADFVALCQDFLGQLGHGEGGSATNEGELAAFISYSKAFPDGLLALVDSYDTLGSGVENFLAVALALDSLGHKAVGIRLDSGDLAYLSRQARQRFRAVAEQFGKPYFAEFNIVASNDINERVLLELKDQGHEIDTFGIGTNLVTCQKQPALGMVFKLVEINGQPRIKLSQEIAKVTIPCRKQVYRLSSGTGEPLLDVIMRTDEPAPQPGQRMLCRHPFDERKRAYVTPSNVQPLQELVWADGALAQPLPSLDQIRALAQAQLAVVREDVTRSVNSTPYKVSVSPSLYTFIHELWQSESPVAELS